MKGVRSNRKVVFDDLRTLAAGDYITDRSKSPSSEPAAAIPSTAMEVEEEEPPQDERNMKNFLL